MAMFGKFYKMFYLLGGATGTRVAPVAKEENEE